MLGNYVEDAYKAKAILMPALREQRNIFPITAASFVARILEPSKSNGRLILACHGARSWGIGGILLYLASIFAKTVTSVIMPDHRGCMTVTANIWATV